MYYALALFGIMSPLQIIILILNFLNDLKQKTIILITFIKFYTFIIRINYKFISIRRNVIINSKVFFISFFTRSLTIANLVLLDIKQPRFTIGVDKANSLLQL